MQHLPAQEVIRRIVRERICKHCYQRPPGSEKLEATAPRACETHCPIFLNLIQLGEIAEQVQSGWLEPYEQAVEKCICSECHLSQSAGDLCADRLNRSCPLSRYLGEVVKAIYEVIPKAPRGES